MKEEGDEDDDRNRHAQQPKQNTFAHGLLLCGVSLT
jgi:hypothetical protein